MKNSRQILIVFLILSFVFSQGVLFFEIKKDLKENFYSFTDHCEEDENCCPDNEKECCTDGCTCVPHSCSLSAALCYLPNPLNINFVFDKQSEYLSLSDNYSFIFNDDFFHPPARI
ncbi:MAG: hypothetical protein N3F09_00595 [Bacteroidia bacterium]|nr:hypothetical protein [Bacteroidia bacterium]